MLKMSTMTLIATLCVPAIATAKAPIITVDALVSPLVEARAADVVRKGCPAYSANMIRAFGEARKLEKKAIGMGYAKEEIRAFIKDDAAKTEVKKRANTLLADLGARGDAASLCKAGDALVARSPLAAKLISR